MKKPKLYPQRLISVCSEAHLETWEIAYSQLRGLLGPEEIWLIVPDESAKLFERSAGPEVAVIAESTLSWPFIDNLNSSLEDTGNSNRLGWYLQQFLKLAALRQSGDLARVLIWDADTVPLKSMRFFSDKGELTFYPGKEHHLPYFRAISRLLNLEKRVSFSFVSQNFPITGEIIQDFVTYVESESGGDFWEAILGSIEWHEQSGFSEYETLGTYISHFFPEKIRLSRKKWERNGWKYFRQPRDVLRSRVAILFPAYVSFESHHQDTPQTGLLGSLVECIKGTWSNFREKFLRGSLVVFKRLGVLDPVSFAQAQKKHGGGTDSSSQI